MYRFRQQLYECLGKRTEARNCLKRALQIALPDQFYLPFVENYEYLEELLQREIQTADAAEHVFLTEGYRTGEKLSETIWCAPENAYVSENRCRADRAGTADHRIVGRAAQ